jgi:hypothetical protein
MSLVSSSGLRSLLLASALTAVIAPAFPEPPKSRGDALKALASPDTTTRAEAVVWLANRGAMSDAPLLHRRLRDESGLVRSYAEQGLWLLWSRSGDAAIDQLMARGSDELQADRLAEAIQTFSEVIRRFSSATRIISAPCRGPARSTSPCRTTSWRWSGSAARSRSIPT